MSAVQTIVVFPRGQLSDADRARMAEFGVLVAEADNPADVAVVSLIPGEAHIGGGDMLASALHALSKSTLDGPARLFVDELNRRMKAKEAAETAAGAQP